MPNTCNNYCREIVHLGTIPTNQLFSCPSETCTLIKPYHLLANGCITRTPPIERVTVHDSYMVFNVFFPVLWPQRCDFNWFHPLRKTMVSFRESLILLVTVNPLKKNPLYPPLYHHTPIILIISYNYTTWHVSACRLNHRPQTLLSAGKQNKNHYYTLYHHYTTMNYTTIIPSLYHHSSVLLSKPLVVSYHCCQHQDIDSQAHLNPWRRQTCGALMLTGRAEDTVDGPAKSRSYPTIN